jgi:hypothetical protein
MAAGPQTGQSESHCQVARMYAVSAERNIHGTVHAESQEVNSVPAEKTQEDSAVMYCEIVVDKKKTLIKIISGEMIGEVITVPNNKHYNILNSDITVALLITSCH